MSTTYSRVFRPMTVYLKTSHKATDTAALYALSDAATHASTIILSFLFYSLLGKREVVDEKSERFPGQKSLKNNSYTVETADGTLFNG
ncbi:hypothetical protein G4Y79_19590 [Phototrophicus methaneseepsis]|uniref:Uncharacterized protein n=1 Tax=Phototrophicus methaneseepsis TaxID=2710758 RepID=A0A7S8IDY8_9CHLR|nr:hypothetical protein [Phototrophicus methaneseepsis]QPC81869.1 hypothetical protein G4Y79_19590 [Phototrophicus methaneseepsis]